MLTRVVNGVRQVGTTVISPLAMAEWMTDSAKAATRKKIKEGTYDDPKTWEYGDGHQSPIDEDDVPLQRTYMSETCQYLFGLCLMPYLTGDHSGCVMGCVDIKTKVAFYYKVHILKRNLCFDVNKI